MPTAFRDFYDLVSVHAILAVLHYKHVLSTKLIRSTLRMFGVPTQPVDGGGLQNVSYSPHSPSTRTSHERHAAGSVHTLDSHSFAF